MNRIIWDREFGKDYAPPKEILELVKMGKLTDDSWGNDICPSFSRMENEVRFVLWVHPEDVNQREHKSLPRYQIYREPGSYGQRDVELYSGDDILSAVIAVMGSESFPPEIWV